MKRNILCWLVLPFVLVAQEPPSSAAGQQKGAHHEEEPDTFFDSPDDRKLCMVQTQVEYVEMPHEKLTELLFMRNETHIDATELRKRVQELVKEGTATVLETQLTIGEPGYRPNVETRRESTYPTHFSWRSLPASISFSGDAPVVGETLSDALGGPLPERFETRNVGSFLTVEASGDAKGVISLSFQTSLVWNAGDVVLWKRTKSPEDTDKAALPEFYSIALNTRFCAKDGQYVLAGVASPKDGKGQPDFNRKVMIFVKANALIVE